MRVYGITPKTIMVNNTDVPYPFAQGYNVRIGPHWFRTVASHDVPIRFGTKDSLAKRQDVTGSIYENVLDIGYAWARTDLSGGEGLDWDPRILAIDQDQQGYDKIRYWSSANLDVARPDKSGQRYSLRLSRSIEYWDKTFTNPVDIGASEKHIYVADGNTLYQYAGWGDNTPETIVATDDIIALAAAPNGTVMVTCENGNVYAKRSDELVFTKVYGDGAAKKLAAHGVWYVQGRFIISAWDQKDSASLFTVEWAYDQGVGAWQPEKPIDSASSPFWSVVESGPAVVSACGDGTLRSYAPDTKSGVVDLVPYSRITMPEGETPILLGSNANVLLVMTSMSREDTDRDELRIYQAEVLDDRFAYTVGNIQLRREWLGTHHEPLVTRNMVNTRDEIFWFVREADIDVWGDPHGLALEALWRFDVVTNGISRETVVPLVPPLIPHDPPIQQDQINLNGLVIFANIAGGIDYTSKRVVMGDKEHFQPFGYMIFPNVTFGLNTDITWMATVLEATALIDQGAQVELYWSTTPEAIHDWRHGSWILARRMSSMGSSGLEVPIQGLQSRSIALQLRIAASQGATNSPEVTHVAIRGIPSHRDLVIQVPVDISDIVSVPHRQPIRVPGLGHELHSQILGKIGESVEVALIRPPVLMQGIVNDVSEPVDYVSPRGSVTTYVYVEFRGMRMESVHLAVGDAGIGLGLLGITTVGIGQTEQE